MHLLLQLLHARRANQLATVGNHIVVKFTAETATALILLENNPLTIGEYLKGSIFSYVHGPSEFHWNYNASQFVSFSHNTD
jgi:hypothetical protein